MARKRAQQIRRGCIWCGGAGPWSDEHAIAQWLSNCLQERLGIRTPNFAVDGMWYDEDDVRAQPTKRVQLKLQVCTACNSGWMSAMETAVMSTLPPLIFGETLTLSDDQCRDLAAWAMKTLVNLAFMAHRDANELYPVPVRDHLREEREPPQEAFIVAARFSGLERKLRTRVQDAVLRKPGGSLIGVTALATTLIHAVAFQMLSHNLPGAGTPTHGAVAQGAAIVLWPPVLGGSVAWPPPASLASDEFDFFADPPPSEVHAIVDT